MHRVEHIHNISYWATLLAHIHAFYGCLLAVVPCGCPAPGAPFAAAGCVWWACVAELFPALPPGKTGPGAAGHLGGNGEITEAATAAACWLASTAAATHTERQQAINVSSRSLWSAYWMRALISFPAVAVVVRMLLATRGTRNQNLFETSIDYWGTEGKTKIHR